jgi:hypothetical protein
MCSSNTCPLKESCYRFTATPSPYRQTYADFQYDEEIKSCDYYWNNKKYEDEKRKDRRVDDSEKAEGN